MEPSHDDLRSGAVAPEDRAVALQLVFGHLPTEDRRRRIEAVLATQPDARTPAEGLLGAYRGDRLVGAVWYEVQPGRTAIVWPPRVVAGEPVSTAAMLLDVACKRLAQLDVRVAQALLRTDTSPDAAALLKGGFVRLAKLFYLVALDGEFPATAPTSALVFEPYSPANHDRLAAMVEATYGQTLDCPALNGVRHMDDVLAGYRATGTFDPQWWLIVRHDTRDVGCLLLADHPDDGNFELVYMGLAISARGQGWGRQIARHAQWLARQAARPRLVLAVDAANEPALKMYATVGFRAWDRRIAHVKILAPAVQV